MATLFISSAKLKNDSALSGSVDDNMIHPYILNAQTKEIFPYLGTDLYDKLITDIGGTPSGVYKTLLDDYIAPAMLQWTLYECSVSMLFKYRNKSVSTKNSENSNPVDYRDLQFLRDDWKNKAEERDKRLINYLCDNESKYPKYTASSDDLSPRKTAYQEGFYLGGGNSNCWRDEYKYYKDL